MSERLNNLQIASPCTEDWSGMVGNDRVRFCNSCSLNVYNISNMTPVEAESLLQEKEGKVCMRLYRRPDGTVLTRDCPKGLQAVRQRMVKVAGLVGTLVLGLFGMPSAYARGNQTEMGDFVVGAPPPQVKVQPLMGAIKPPPKKSEKENDPIMGEVALPPEMGKIAPNYGHTIGQPVVKPPENPPKPVPHEMGRFVSPRPKK